MMISESKVKGVTRKPLPMHAKSQAYSPNAPTFPNFGVASPVAAAIPTFEQRDSAPFQTHSIASVLSQTSRQQNNIPISLSEISSPGILMPACSTSRPRVRIPARSGPHELEGNQQLYQSTITGPSLNIPPSQQFAPQYVYQPAIPQPQLPQSYFIMDPTTGMANYPTSQVISIARPISSPAAISTSYEFLGVPVVTSYNPVERAKEVIIQRYAQEFRGMTSMGEALIRKLVDVGLEREGRRFEGLVWTGAPNEELVGFAEWLMRDGD